MSLTPVLHTSSVGIYYFGADILPHAEQTGTKVRGVTATVVALTVPLPGATAATVTDGVPKGTGDASRVHVVDQSRRPSWCPTDGPDGIPVTTPVGATGAPTTDRVYTPAEAQLGVSHPDRSAPGRYYGRNPLFELSWSGWFSTS